MPQAHIVLFEPIQQYHTIHTIACTVSIYLYTYSYIFIVNSLPLHTHANAMVVTFHPLSQLMSYTHLSLVLYLLTHKRTSHARIYIYFLIIMFFIHHLFYHYIIHIYTLNTRKCHDSFKHSFLCL